MKLKDYIKQLQVIAKTHPNATVVYSSDEEGNSYSEVVYSPTLGRFDGEREFDDATSYKNAVCIN